VCLSIRQGSISAGRYSIRFRMSLSPLPEEEEDGEEADDVDVDVDVDDAPKIGRAPVTQVAAIAPRLDDAASSADHPRHKAAPSELSSTIPSESTESSPLHAKPVLLLLRGVLGAKTIRSTYACLHVARLPSASSTTSRSSVPAGGGKDDGGAGMCLASDDEESDDDEGDDERGDDEDDAGGGRATYCMVRLQFTGDDGNVRALKSLCRRAFKHRDLIRVQVAALCTSGYGEGDSAPDVLRGTTSTEAMHRPPRPSSIHQGRTFVIHLGSIQEAIDTIHVEAVRYWDVLTFQKWQRQNLQWMQLSSVPPQSAPRRRSSRRTVHATACEGCNCQIQCTIGDTTNPAQQAPPLSGCGGCSGQFHSSSNLDRQVQAEYVANFLFHMILNKVCEEKEEEQQQLDVITSDDDAPGAQRRDASTSPCLKPNSKEVTAGKVRQSILLLPPEQWATTLPHALLERLHQQLLQEDDEPPASNLLPDGRNAHIQLAAKHQYELDVALFRRAFQILNAGTGVLDVAGGSGYLSQALGACGIQATVVDPRENVGTLPRRHRKAWRKLVQRHKIQNGETTGSEHSSLPDLSSAGCVPPPPVQFQFLRAWFGTPPKGVDEGFRHPDLETKGDDDDDANCGMNDSSFLALPVVDDSHDLLRGCSALVALHPDEATDSVVDAAVSSRKPFCVVPCCVFSRLFPNRRVVGGCDADASSRPVCTRADLVDYLCEKHPDIQRATLPFVGSNTILWSTF
jgi:hypothetical protein